MSPSTLPADLTDAEMQLVEAAEKGRPADYRKRNKELDDPAKGASWGPERTIRAEVIYALAVGDNSLVHAKGVQIYGAKIAGPLDLEGAKIPHPLFLVGCFIGEPITLMDADTLSIYFTGSRVAEIRADRLRTHGSVFLRDGFQASGEVRLLGASIAGNLDCSRGTFENVEDDALSADGATVDGNVFLNKRFHATGAVRLPGARIGGHFDCSGGIFENAKADALNASSATINGTAFLRDGFQASGEVRLLWASIAGNLECSRGTFENADGKALSVDGATVDGSVLLDNGFHAKGEVRLSGAKIGSQLSCSDGTFENANGIALNLERASVTATFFLSELLSRPVGVVNLAYAEFGDLNDDEKSWPENGKLLLDGFVYGRLAGPKTPWRARERLHWLRLQPERYFRTQPYEQLIKVLKEMGHEQDAREVAIAKQVQLRKHGGLGRLSRVKNWLLDKTIKYGYESWRALVLLFAVWLLGTGMFCMAEWTGLMVPSEKEAYVSYQWAAKPLPPGYPIFHAPLYAIDTLLPGINLNQKAKWYLRERTGGDLWYWVFEVGLFIYFVVAWLLTLIGGGAVTGLIKPH